MSSSGGIAPALLARMLKCTIQLATVISLGLLATVDAHGEAKRIKSSFRQAAKAVVTVDKRTLAHPVFKLPASAEDITISSFTRQARVVRIGKYAHRGNHWGIDFTTSGKTNVPVTASGDGKILKVQKGCPNGRLRRCGGGFGNFVKIQHANGIVTMYAHLDNICMGKIKAGQSVVAGTPIGCIGNSGTSTGFHLCFRAFDSAGKPMLPEILLGSALAHVDRKDDVAVPKHLSAIAKVLTEGTTTR